MSQTLSLMLAYKYGKTSLPVDEGLKRGEKREGEGDGRERILAEEFFTWGLGPAEKFSHL